MQIERVKEIRKRE